MKTMQRYRAVDVSKWIILSLLLALGGICLKFGIFPATIEDKIMFSICCIIIFPHLLYHMIHTTYLSDNGVEFCRLGRVVRQLSWGNIEKVCIIRNFRFSNRVSNVETKIVFLPAGYKPRGNLRWGGLIFLFLNRNDVIWVDDTKQNRQIIEKKHGEIMDWRNI